MLEHIGSGTQLIVPLANGEPTAVLDAIEAATDRLDGVGVHRMRTIHDQAVHQRAAQRQRLRHVSYFLSHITRPHFAVSRDRSRAVPLLRGVTRIIPRANSLIRR